MLVLDGWLVFRKPGLNVVLISDGNSDKSAHVLSIIFYLNCARYLIRSRAITNQIFLRKVFFLSCVRKNVRVTILSMYRVFEVQVFSGEG